MEMLYHHTTTEGLLGILSSESLWATDIEFLNDYEEFRVGTSALERYCTRMPEDVAEDFKPLFRNYLDVINRVISSNRNGRRHYVTSFTKLRDDVRQWMSYGKPNASYSIGFERRSLDELCKRFSSISEGRLVGRLSEVAYVDKDNPKFPILEDYLDAPRFVKKINNGTLTQDGIEKYTQDLIDDLMFGLSASKWQAFAEEQEVRLVLSTRDIDAVDGQLCFRSSGGIVTPYQTVKINIKDIKEIRIGPATDAALARKGLDQLVAKYGLKCNVASTETSLRQF